MLPLARRAATIMVPMYISTPVMGLASGEGMGEHMEEFMIVNNKKAMKQSICKSAMLSVIQEFFPSDKGRG